GHEKHRGSEDGQNPPPGEARGAQAAQREQGAEGDSEAEVDAGVARAEGELLTSRPEGVRSGLSADATVEGTQSLNKGGAWQQYKGGDGGDIGRAQGNEQPVGRPGGEALRRWQTSASGRRSLSLLDAHDHAPETFTTASASSIPHGGSPFGWCGSRAPGTRGTVSPAPPNRTPPAVRRAIVRPARRSAAPPADRGWPAPPATARGPPLVRPVPAPADHTQRAFWPRRR